MRFFYLFFLCLTTPTVLSETLVFGSLDHPHFKKYDNVIAQSYAALGIDVELISTPVLRRLKAANDGTFDGVVLASSNLKEEFPNLVAVQPILGRVSLNLVCLKDYVCDDSVLFESNKVIITNVGTVKAIEDRFNREFTAKIYEMDKLETYIALLEHKRAAYAIYRLDENQKLPERLVSLTNVHRLYETSFNHYIHKKHNDKLASLSEQIAKQLDALKY